MTALSVLLVYNWARFGAPLETGYGAEASAFSGDPLVGLIGLLLSPGRGAVYYIPWFIPAMLGARMLWRTSAAGAVFIFGGTLTLLFLYAPWHMWEGGWCLGPRFLIPIAPLLVIPAAMWCRTHWHKAWFRFGSLSFIACSLAFGTQAIRINYLDFYYAAYNLTPDIQHTLRWSLDWSPIFAYWTWPESNFLLLPRILVGQGGGWLQAMAIAFVIGLTSTTYRMMRIFSPTPPPDTERGP